MNATANEILAGINDAIQRGFNEAGGDSTAVNPGHRVSFHWPPHSVSRDYHVTQDCWQDESEHEIRGEIYTIQWASTEHGVFGRIIDLWNEAKGESREEVLSRLIEGADPWFDRMDAISKSIGLPSRFHGQIVELSSPDIAKLLFCSDRDVASAAVVEIEKRASTAEFLPSFIAILRDGLHPNRRTAQWCVLDMLEDYSAFCKTDAEMQEVVDAIEFLMSTTHDDYARAIYKAGVVLGGHFCNEPAANALIKCLTAPSKIGRRSAMHAVFHLVEWLPAERTRVIAALQEAAKQESEPLLKEFALSQARDISSGASDHMEEPVFAEEISA